MLSHFLIPLLWPAPSTRVGDQNSTSILLFQVLYELFLNAGPLERVTIPKDRETKQQKSFGFIVFEHEESVKFAYDLLNGVELHRGKIRLQNKTTGLG